MKHTPFNVTTPHLNQRARRLAASYASAAPFAHTYIDDLFPRAEIASVAAEIPETMLASGCVAGAAACYRKNRRVHYRKSELHHETMGPHTRGLFAALRSEPFVRFLELLSGIGGLVPDPGYEGSGVHLTGEGGLLAVHHDFNWMHCAVDHRGSYGDCARPGNPSTPETSQRVRLHRRVNVFVYLNAGWRDEYGGHLELWPRNLSACARRILPSLGRLAMFSSTDFSFHGHPRPLRPPPGRMRRSLALYYYTPGPRPPGECEDSDCETFRNADWQSIDLGRGSASVLR